MSLTAIVSDIHGNLPALETVLADAREQGAERFWCLGDVVGYGANPSECLTILRELCQHMIRGNHEQAVLDGPYGFNPLAAAAIRWTREEVASVDDHLAFIAELPERIDTEHAVLVHGSPSHPLDEYLFREDTLSHLPRNRDYSPKLARCFRHIDRPCFVGHTHIPGVIDGEFRWIAPAECNDAYDTEGRPCIVNVGSVGQPRDGDTRASYALFDGRTVRFRRLTYDVESAAMAIFNTPDLPDPLGRRLIEGW